MIIKKHKDIYKEASKTLELSEDLVSLLGEFVYKELCDSLTNLEYREVYVYKLGSFRFRRKKSLDYIRKSRNMKDRMLKMGHALETAEKGQHTVDTKVTRMNKLNEEWSFVMEEKQEYKKRKEQYYVDRDIQK